MGQIERAVKKLINNINDKGHVFRNTREIIYGTVELDVLSMNMEDEERSVISYYGDRFNKRMSDEIFHYEQIKFSLFHKIKETDFFFKEYLESRKIIVMSNDCISSAQYIKRGSYTGLFVHMRSSDVRELLPLDLLYLSKILIEINNQFVEDPIDSAELVVTIGSAHYYLEGGRN
jgi:hypothetical protein